LVFLSPDSYRRFARSFFPRAQLVADKFHVLRLLTPAIHRALHALKLPKEALPMYRVLRKNPSKLTPSWRWKLRCWLADKPALRELCAAREAIFRLYRVRGHGRASKALTRLTDAMAHSSLPEVQTFRTTLMRWRREVLAYFLCRLERLIAVALYKKPGKQVSAWRALRAGFWRVPLAAGPRAAARIIEAFGHADGYKES
jgi:transposase